MHLRSLVTLFVVSSPSLIVATHAQESKSGSGSPTSVSAPRTTTSRTATRALLPDPALLDGSSMPAEKKSEFGMIGDFELPGDENSKSDKVGGAPSAGGSGGAGKEDPKMAQNGPGGMGSGGPSQSGQQPPKGPNSPGGPGGGQNDPNAKAEGIKVAELKKDEAAGQGTLPDSDVQKPKQIAIGDPTMQIKTAPNAPGVVGATTTAGKTQQMEKAIGGGAGKPPSGDNSNRGVEKGRAMPTGL